MKNRILLVCVALCVIGAVIGYVKNKPKNIFEEIYHAEMYAGEKGQLLPLAHTVYFKEKNAILQKTKGGSHGTTIVEESPTDASQYTLAAMYRTRRRPNSPFWVPLDNPYDLEEKTVNIMSGFVYRNVEIKVRYQYVVFKYDTSGDSSEKIKDGGVYVYFSDSVARDRLTEFSDFEAHGISKDELKQQIEENLNEMLNYWVDNYQHSRFKNNEFGEYDIDWSNRGRIDEY